MFAYVHQFFQIPVDICVYIIYLGAEINPLALTGLLAYLILFPFMGVLITKVVTLQKKIMSLRDMRVKRATEVINGIKVIKLFSLEDI